MKNKINLYLCGGAAINMYNNELSKISEYGDGFTTINPYYLDTSDSNMLNKNEETFFKFNKDDVTGTILDGSGGERSINAKHIMYGIDEFVNKYDIHKLGLDTYHIVVFSAAGGTGSTSGPLLVRKLMDVDLPVIVMMVGDSRSVIYAINTLNVIATLNNFALKANKALNVIYRNNDIDTIAGDNAEDIINIHMKNVLSGIAVFLSGEHIGIDNQDMVHMFTQTKYKTIKIVPGLCGIDIMVNGYLVPDEQILIGSRTLYCDENDKQFIVSTLDGDDKKDIIPVLHHFKYGKVVNENILKLYNKNLPLHMYTYYGVFDKEQLKLRNITDNMYSVMDNMTNKHMEGSSRSIETDDGLVF